VSTAQGTSVAVAGGKPTRHIHLRAETREPRLVGNGQPKLLPYGEQQDGRRFRDNQSGALGAGEEMRVSLAGESRAVTAGPNSSAFIQNSHIRESSEQLCTKLVVVHYSCFRKDSTAQHSTAQHSEICSENNDHSMSSGANDVTHNRLRGMRFQLWGSGSAGLYFSRW